MGKEIKRKVTFDTTPERWKWMSEFARSKGVPVRAVIEATIDLYRNIPQDATGVSVIKDGETVKNIHFIGPEGLTVRDQNGEIHYLPLSI